MNDCNWTRKTEVILSHIFNITDDSTCLCKKSNQTTNHLLWECELLRQQRQGLRNSIMKVGGNWPITSFDLANMYKLQNLFRNL
jgi:hypothetical protein